MLKEQDIKDKGKCIREELVPSEHNVIMVKQIL